MCQIDNSETYAVWGHRRIAASRKDHRCAECYRVISRGEPYERYTGGPSFGVDGGWDVFPVCAHCQVAAQWLVRECRGFVHTQVIEDIQEHAETYRRADLYRLVVSSRKKWIRRGALVPIPPIPRPIQLVEKR